MADRETLERAAIAAALDLFPETGAAAFVLPIPNTSPPLYVACGEAQQIARLMEATIKCRAEAVRKRLETAKQGNGGFSSEPKA